MSKVVALARVDFIMNNPDELLRGFVSKNSDISDLATPNQLYENLRLDYGGGPIQGDGLGLIEFPSTSIDFSIPVKPAITQKYPYSGNGFLTTREARTQPEWLMAQQPFPLGSQIFKLDPFGNKVLHAVRTESGWQLATPFTP